MTMSAMPSTPSSAGGDAPVTGTNLNQIEMRIRGEFNEMPGLSLTAAQAQRLLGLSGAECNLVLGRLVACGFLHHGAGKYRRADGA